MTIEKLIAAAKADPFVLEKVDENDLIKTLEDVLSGALLSEGEKIIQLYMPIVWDDGYLVQTQTGNVYRLYLVKRSDPKKSLDFNIVGSFLESHGAQFVIDKDKGEVSLGPTHWIITDHKVFLKAFTEIPSAP